MYKCLIFGGTSEGRQIAEFCVQQQIPAIVSVATDYGKESIINSKRLTIQTGRLSKDEMESLINSESIAIVIDATHPYAIEVTNNISSVCEKIKIPYIRCIRNSELPTTKDDRILYFESIKEVVGYLAEKDEIILITTGSKELEQFCTINRFEDRVYARVLPDPQVLSHCKEMGLTGQHLYAMQGPFSERMNIALLLETKAKYLVTKESGQAGGFLEKVNAARKVGVQTLIVGRPTKEQGQSPSEVKKIIADFYEINQLKQIPKSRNITLIGMGMGASCLLTLEARTAIEESDAIIGSKRLLATIGEWTNGKQVHEAYEGESIRTWLKSHTECLHIAIVLSGDVGFYSGAKKLTSLLSDDPLTEIVLMPGISSVVYLCAKLKISWEDIKLLSLHGREGNPATAINSHLRCFLLVGGEGGVHELCKVLIEAGLNDVSMWIGERLSYPEERITFGYPQELLHKQFNPLSAVLIENPLFSKDSIITHGLPDQVFIRGNVPMTKSEVRSITLSKLGLTKYSIVYDIGAGTGSVAIEAALQATHGKVYAIEKNTDAIELIKENKRKFKVSNLTIIEGTAPKICLPLEPPTHAFIGGSSGSLREIATVLLSKNPEIRIVFNAITLETLMDIVEWIKSYSTSDCEIIQVAISKSETIGKYHMMRGMNPIYIITFCGRNEDETILP